MASHTFAWTGAKRNNFVPLAGANPSSVALKEIMAPPGIERGGKTYLAVSLELPITQSSNANSVAAGLMISRKKFGESAAAHSLNRSGDAGFSVFFRPGVPPASALQLQFAGSPLSEYG